MSLVLWEQLWTLARNITKFRDDAATNICIFLDGHTIVRFEVFREISL